MKIINNNTLGSIALGIAITAGASCVYAAQGNDRAGFDNLRGKVNRIFNHLDTDLSESQREYMDIIESSAQSLLAIINQVLDLAAIENTTLTLDYAPLQLREFLEHTLDVITRLFAA